MGDDHQHAPWNKGKLIGQTPPLKLKDICAIRTVFSLAIDSKLYGCDLTCRRQ